MFYLIQGKLDDQNIWTKLIYFELSEINLKIQGKPWWSEYLDKVNLF